MWAPLEVIPSLLLPSPPKPTTVPTTTALLSFEFVILASSTLRFASGTIDKTSEKYIP